MFIKEAWFWRGFQSAIFYYISCAPCTKVLDQRRKKQNAARAKAEKAARKAAQAQLVEDGNAAEPDYDHPLPSSTNPFWEEEMQLGPGPPSKRRNRQGVGDGHGRERGRESKEKARKKSGSTEMMQTTNTVAAGTRNGVGTSSDSNNKNTTLNINSTMHGDNSTAATLANAIEIPQDPSDADWNRRRYQREDEVLWGLDGDDYHPPKTKASGVPLSRNSSSGHRRQQNYSYARNPAVNDLHPPVVSTVPKSRLEGQWMLQPPPRAKVMAGKERASRERSDTGSTRSSRASSKWAGLNGSRSGEMKMKRAGNTAVNGNQLLGVDSITRSRSRGSSNHSVSSSRPISRTPSAQRGETIAPSLNSHQPSRTPSQRKPPPPISIETAPNVTLPPSPSLQAARPGLQTIPSTSLVHTSKDGAENSRPNPPLPSLATDGMTSTSPSSNNNILQSNSNQPNRVNSLKHHNNNTNRDTDTVTIEAPPPPPHKQTTSPLKEDKWHFPGAEDGWAFPLAARDSQQGKVSEGDGEMDAGMEMRPGMGHRHQQRWSMDI